MTIDLISASSIADGLGVCLVGQKVLYFPTVGSTMSLAREEARRGADEGTAIIASQQTEGRGRLGRSWVSPEGSIAVSLILRPRVSQLPYLVMLASLAVANTVEKVAGLKPKIKWPNDVLVEGKKVSGILVESDVRGGQVRYAIIGVGINVNVRTANYPEIPPSATSLSEALEHEVSRLEVVRRFLVETDALYVCLGDGSEVFRHWQDKLVTLGQWVKVQTGESLVEGMAESVNGDGSLVVRGSGGTCIRIVAGDVS